MRILLNIGLTFLFCFQLSAQNKIEKEFVNQSLKSVLEHYSDSYRLTFAYDADKLDAIVINKKIEAFSISELIQKTFDGLPFTYQLIDNIYLILNDNNKILVIEPMEADSSQVAATEVSLQNSKPKEIASETRKRNKVDTIDFYQKESKIIEIKNNKKKPIQINQHYEIEPDSITFTKPYSYNLEEYNIKELSINYFGQNDPVYALSYFSSIYIENDNYSRLYYNNSISSDPTVFFEGIPLFDLSQLFETFSVFNNSSFSTIEVNPISKQVNFKNEFSITTKEKLQIHITQNLLNSDLNLNYRPLKQLKIALKLRKSINNGLNLPGSNKFFNSSIFQLQDSLYQINNRTFILNDIGEISSNYYDFLSSIELKLSNQTIKLSGIYSLDRFQIKESPDLMLSFLLQEKTKSNFGLNLNWNADWSKRFKTYSNLYFSQYYSEFLADKNTWNPIWLKNEIQSDLNYVQAINFKFISDYAFNGSNAFSAKINYQHLSSDFKFNNGLYSNTLRSSIINSFSITLNQHHFTNSQSFKYGAEFKLINGELSLLPFIQGSFQMNKSHFGIQYNYSVDQMNRETILGSNSDQLFIFNYSEIPINSSHNFILEYLNSLNSLIDFKVIARYQIISDLNLPLLVQDESFNIEYENFHSGLGRNITIGLNGIYHNQWYNGILSYNHSNLEASFNVINSGNFFSHSLFPSNAFNSFNEIKFRNFTFNLNWKFQTNKYYYSPLGKHYIFISDGVYSGLITDDKRNTEVLPAFHRLDLNIAYHLRTKYSQISIGLNIFNVYNRKNLLIINYEPIDYINTSLGEIIPVYKTTNFYSRPIIPSIKLTLDF